MEVYTESRVKNDLKSLKYFNNSVKIYERASKYFLKQYELAKSTNMLSKDEMTSLKNCLDLIDSNIFVQEQMTKKENYLKCIKQLDSLTQAIIIDAFINDSSYVEISHRMYCSVETVKRRVKSGLIEIVAMLNKENSARD